MSRSFTDHERNVLLRLVTGAQQEDVLRAQIDASEYGEPWFRGARSFTIIPVSNAPVYEADSGPSAERTPGPGAQVLKDGSQPLHEGNLIGEVFLWLRAGKISDLEYSWVTDEMPDSLPALDQFR
ncbi:hypothetical protein [Leifsonia poae]|uniref:Uncharacterized protein n=1 Tax=Leifsonia poae TaxID=110933 RepID=A0A9W6LYD9_9MICO|nr:hypothetical protein [Leifsonia poae]GLJ74477.1 hypothetical protein GCM10017584_00500 [Leifsonia poae]